METDSLAEGSRLCINRVIDSIRRILGTDIRTYEQHTIKEGL